MPTVLQTPSPESTRVFDYRIEYFESQGHFVLDDTRGVDSVHGAWQRITWTEDWSDVQHEEIFYD